MAKLVSNNEKLTSESATERTDYKDFNECKLGLSVEGKDSEIIFCVIFKTSDF